MKIREIERLRGLAVLLVMLSHMPELLPVDLGPDFVGSYGGVDLFFVISGFVVTLSLLASWSAEYPDGAENWKSVREFWARRFFRIAPVALLFLLIQSVAVMAFNRSGAWGAPSEMFQEVFAVLSVQYNYALPYWKHSQLGEYWSLMVEEHFYLILPLFFLAFRSPRARICGALIGAAAVALVIRPFLTAPTGVASPFWYYYGASHRKFDPLFLGALLALVKTYYPMALRQEVSRRTATIASLAAVCVVWLSHWLLPYEYNCQHGNIGVALASLILVYLASLNQDLILGWRGVRKVFEVIGARSYILYLAHRPVGALIWEVRFRYTSGNVWLSDIFNIPLSRSLVSVLILFALTEVIHRKLEIPLRALGRKSRPSVTVYSQAA